MVIKVHGMAGGKSVGMYRDGYMPLKMRKCLVKLAINRRARAA